MILYLMLVVLVGLVLSACLAWRTDWAVMHDFRMDLMQKYFRQEEDIDNLKSQIRDLEGKLPPGQRTPSEDLVAEGLIEGMHSLDYAKKWRLCRICGGTTQDPSTYPIKLHFGEEHAHQSCLDQA